MRIEVNEIINWVYSNYEDELVEVHTITGDNAVDCFKRVYALERSSRYDSERRYEIANPDIGREYKEWKQHGVTIEMYYGSATVD